MMMIFKGVSIERDFRGKLTGKLHVGGDFGRAYLNLTDELCARIMAVCADNIVEAAGVIASEFRHEALQIGSVTLTNTEE